LAKVNQFPELNSYEKVEELRQKYGFNNFGGDNAFLILGGLHDYIFRTPRNQLISWALAADQYSKNGELIVGGIHDYVHSLSNKEIADFILDLAGKFPELNSAEKLDALVKKYGTEQ